VDNAAATALACNQRFSPQRISCGRQSPCATKVCLYSHDTFGLGHLRRNLAIAEQLLRREGRFTVWLLTGSPVIRSWRLPRALHVQPLPPVVKTGAERYAARMPGHTFCLTKGYREALILKLVTQERPDVLLVDHAPAGMKGELLPTLALLRNELPQTRIVLGLRDILDAPAAVRQLWQEQEIFELIEHAYDDVLVYGSEDLFDVIENYGLPEGIASKVRYCGHVVGREWREEESGHCARGVCWDDQRACGRPVVLVTAGGGGDGFVLMEAYLRSLRLFSSDGFHSVLVAGPLMPSEAYARLALAATQANVQLVSYTTDLMPSIRAASLVVSMAGYNTSVELLAARKKAILVPRGSPREEQKLRAAQLARRGLASCVEADGELPGRLAVLVPQMLAAKPAGEAVWDSVNLRGADRVAEYLASVTQAAPRRAGVS
jgi:predicted glycosyltransferase